MKAKAKMFFKILGILLLLIFVAFIGFFVYFNVKIANYSKSIDFDKSQLLLAYSKPEIFDDDNNAIKFSTTNSIVNFNEIPNHTKDAFISIEDKTFYKHNGFNYKRIGKAVFNNIKSKGFKEGASTISQQLVKNAFLSNEKTIDRKLKEVALTKKLEKNFSKDEILEIYLNTIYFGNNNFGIENASLSYFNKNAKNLSINESAILASIIKSPSFYSNSNNNGSLLQRKNLVLKQMLIDKKILIEEYNTSINEDVLINYENNLSKNSAYQIAVINEATQKLNISTNDLFKNKYQIYTYYNADKQNKINEIIKENSGELNAENGSVLINNATLGVAALSSSLPNFYSINRQPGSTIKPILVYAPALEMGKIQTSTPILDEKINFDGYSPKNANGKFSGYVSAQKAVENSLNVPAVKTLNYVGVDNAKFVAKKMGLTFSANDNNLSMALGCSENGTDLLTLAGAYSTLANQGKFEKPHFIKEIKDLNGKTIYKHQQIKKEAIREDTAYLTTKMLLGVSKTGTAKLLKDFDFDIASKTGTVGVGIAGKNSDVYNFSATTSHTLGVWFGSKDNSNKNLLNSNITGSTLPTNCVKEIFSHIYKTNKPANFTKPETVKEIEIDSIELEQNHKIVLASPNSPERYRTTIDSSVFFLPKETSTNFLEPNNPSLIVVYNKDSNEVNISFDAKDFEKYEIFKNGKLLKNVEGENSTIKIIDDDVKTNQTINYQIKTKQNFGDKTLESSLSEPKEIFVSKKEAKISNKELKNIESIFQSIFSKK